MNDLIKAFPLRLPQSLYEKIEATAKQNRRSVNAEIAIAIEQYTDAETRARREAQEARRERENGLSEEP